MKKQVILVLVVFLVVGTLVTASEDCDFWCKVGDFFSGNEVLSLRSERSSENAMVGKAGERI